MDADRASNHRHDVLCEGSGFVGANHAGIGHRLARTKNSNKQVFSGHTFRGEGQGQCNGERKTWPVKISAKFRDDDQKGLTFWDGDNDQSDGDNEDLNEAHGLFVARSVGIRAQLNEEFDHEGREENETGGTTKFSDELGESIELEL